MHSLGGKHVIVDAYDVHDDIFVKLSENKYDDFDLHVIKSFKNNHMTLLSKTINHFNQNGAVTALYLLSESHFSLHTWPEHNFISFDAFTYGKCNTEKFMNDVLNYIGSANINKMVIDRGIQGSFNNVCDISTSHDISLSHDIEWAQNASLQ
jgi:S-adenosylmethionine decarboxylase proenzyme